MNSKSLTYRCFPHIRFIDGEKRLWSPVARQAFKIRPEERVRLETVEFLNRRCGISYSRMSTEQGIRTASSENTVRTDILIRDRESKPSLLVECKAPDVKLDERAAIQIAQYNTSIKAPRILLTNGQKSFLFKVNESGLTVEPIQLLIVQEEPERGIDYWIERGFAGKNSDEDIRSCLNELYEELSNITYMELPDLSQPLSLSHYYRLEKTGNDSGWGIGLMRDKQQKNWLIGLQFIKGKGKSIVCVDINERITYYTDMNQPEPPVIKVLPKDMIREFSGLKKAYAYKWFDRLLTEIF